MRIKSFHVEEDREVTLVLDEDAVIVLARLLSLTDMSLNQYIANGIGVGHHSIDNYIYLPLVDVVSALNRRRELDGYEVGSLPDPRVVS